MKVKVLFYCCALSLSFLIYAADFAGDGAAIWSAALDGVAASAAQGVEGAVEKRARNTVGMLAKLTSAAVAKVERKSVTEGTITYADGTVAMVKGCLPYVSGDKIVGAIELARGKVSFEVDGGLFAARADEKGELVAIAAAGLRSCRGNGFKTAWIRPGVDVVLVKEYGAWKGTWYPKGRKPVMPPAAKELPVEWTAVALPGNAPAGGYREREEREIEDRIRLIAAPAMGELTVRATFCSAGWHWTCGEKVEGLIAEYRKAGGEWKRGYDPEYFAETKSCRASIVYLDEDADYELRLVAGGRTLKEAKFRTWSSVVPVAKTVEIDPAAFKAPYRIADKGAAGGWIRYTVKGGETLRQLNDAETAILLDGAEYVLIDDMKVVGRADAKFVVDLRGTKNVRIRNCDLSGWGRIGRPDFLGRAFGKPVDKKGNVIDYDGAVNITRGCENTVVERCWIHDALIGANSWRYSHPSGGEAVVVAYAGPGTVIRYNDFVGSDLHRWNDAVEGPGNFYEDGGFNRDADIYGNFMIFCNDDNIELDGGQQNVRCFRNRFENALCGVSVQGCMVGPSYVFDNAFTGGSEEFSLGGAEIKTSGVNLYGNYTCSYICGNDFWKPYTSVNTGDKLMRFVLKDNRSEGESIFHGAKEAPYSVEENDVGNVAFKRDGEIAMPYRPVPYTLDRGLVEGVKLGEGGVNPSEVKIVCTVGGEGYAQPFAVAQNSDFDFFSVSPAKGVLKSGEKTEFTIAFDAAKMKGRHEYRGAFLVRTADGYSRPVSVYAEGQYENPARPEKPGMTALYQAWKGKGDYVFDVPKAGKYFLLMRARSGIVRGYGKMDDGPRIRCKLNSRQYWTWQLVAMNPQGDLRCTRFEFAAGPHTFTFAPEAGDGEVEALVLTDDPGPFEPR